MPIPLICLFSAHPSLKQGNPRRDPEILGQLLEFALRDRAEGGDGLSVCPTFPSHLSAFQAATRELMSHPIFHDDLIPSDYIETTPEWLKLFLTMFHCYFSYMRAWAIQVTPPDPLVDALLLLCDCTDLNALSRSPGYGFMLSSIARCIGEGLSSPESSGNKTLLLNLLRNIWNIEKRRRFSHDPESLMPWSMDSIKEGSLSSTCSSSAASHFG